MPLHMIIQEGDRSVKLPAGLLALSSCHLFTHMPRLRVECVIRWVVRFGGRKAREKPPEPAFSNLQPRRVQPIGMLPHRTVDKGYCGTSMNRASVTTKDTSSPASSLPNAHGMIFPERLPML